MRVITWNLRGAKKESDIWQLILELKPNIALLQEVGGIPLKIKESYDVLSKVAISKSGKPQRFSTAILVKGKMLGEILLKSEYDWVNNELEFFKGNLIACEVEVKNYEKFNVISVYSPAWPVDRNRLKGIDISPVKLKEKTNVWATEIIWSALKNTISNNQRWIVGGDYNSSETFDKDWQYKHGIKFGIRSSGNKEILNRMYRLGFTECLRYFNDKIIPTFKHPRGEIDHQLDHLFVTNALYTQLKSCVVGNPSIIFGKSLSDHLPIIADFKNNK